MRFRNELLVKTLEEANVWIPIPDGARLAPRIWRPVDSDSEPVPAVFEYVPYRNRFGIASGDKGIHPYLAGHG